MLQGDMYDALMNYPLAEAIISFAGARHIDARVVGQHFELGSNIRPEDGPTFGARLEHILSVNDPAVTAVQLNLLDSHDTPRLLTMCGGDVASVRLATLIQMTLPGAPSLYYGDEIGMAGEMDPFCRGAMRWDEATWDHDLLAAVTGAIALRRAHPTLRHGTFTIVAAAGAACAYRRSDDAESFVVAINAGDAETGLALELPELAGRSLVVEPWRGGPARDARDAEGFVVGGDGRLVLTLPARDALVLRTAG